MKVPLFLKIVIPFILLVFVLSFGFYAWAKQGYEAEPEPLEQVRGNEQVVITDTDYYISLRPQQVNGKGLIFYPGAKVDPHAYLWKMSEVATRTNTEVFLVKPRLNMAILSINYADKVRADFPQITSWYMAGHSLGGTAACFYTKEHPEIVGLILLASYCSTDISTLETKVLSIVGGRDQLTTMATIEANRRNLSQGNVIRELPGMNHAQVGDYGNQAGDLPPSIEDGQVREGLAFFFQEFFINN
jgi:hypothetical protein